MSARLGVHVFRVEEGLGNAVALELPNGEWGVVDWGTQRKEALEKLLGLVGGRRVAFVAATHAHSDHTLGISGLLEALRGREIPVGRLVYPTSTLGNKPNAHLTLARQTALKLRIPMSSIGLETFAGPGGLQEPPWVAWGQDPHWEIRALAPSLEGSGAAEVVALQAKRVPGNETSLVLLFRFSAVSSASGLGRVVLPGDASAATLGFARSVGARWPDLTLDNQAFLLAHHGSRDNFPGWLTDHLHGLVIVSAPSNSPHHPADDVLRRLARLKTDDRARVYCAAYAGVCARDYGQGAPPPAPDGPCFGDMSVDVPARDPARVVASSARGDLLRAFGYCSR